MGELRKILSRIPGLGWFAWPERIKELEDEVFFLKDEIERRDIAAKKRDQFKGSQMVRLRRRVDALETGSRVRAPGDTDLPTLLARTNGQAEETCHQDLSAAQKDLRGPGKGSS